MCGHITRVDAPEKARLMAEGRACFLRGEFYEAHEHWEAVWDEADDPERRWIQGMIQVATGLHKVQRGRSDVALGLLRRALDKLRDAPPILSDVDVAAMMTDARNVVTLIDRGEIPDPRKVRA
jgi:uncharacterized protein